MGDGNDRAIQSGTGHLDSEQRRAARVARAKRRESGGKPQRVKPSVPITPRKGLFRLFRKDK